MGWLKWQNWVSFWNNFHTSLPRGKGLCESMDNIWGFSACVFFFKVIIYWAASGFSCSTWDLSLQCRNSLVGAHGLSLSSACGVLVAGSGIEPTSLALPGGFWTTGPPGKSQPVADGFCTPPDMVAKYHFPPLHAWVLKIDVLTSLCPDILGPCLPPTEF